MPRDDDATVVDASSRGGRTAATSSDEAPTRVDGTPTRTPLEATTAHLPQPETVLRSAEIEQSRRTAMSGMVFNAVGLTAAPFFGGDPLARRLFVAGLAGSLLNNAWLYYVASDERRHRLGNVMLYFVVAAFFNTAVSYYVGVFGPIMVMFVLNLYTACLGYERRIALVTLAGGTLPVVLLGGAITVGWIDDPGMVTVTSIVGVVGRGVIILCFALFMVLVYLQARAARLVMVASLTARDEAVRQASHREALFLEARQDLERALHAGGFGRFTDQTLGSFRLGAVLGRGGMGEVYEATHVDSGEEAAVKMLLPEVLTRPEYVRRFMREVRIAASLDSPHVVRVLEVGDETAPLPFLAMERLEGEDLAQILRRRERLEPEEVVELLRQAGRGVAAASEAGIVHRDLKPQNLFLTEQCVWKILDFGVSKLLEGDATITRGETVGTPQYMSPEQARGGQVDVRADLYSLGAIAYRALTGHQPFGGNELAPILAAVLSDMPMRPSALAELPRDVDLVLAIALAKDPDDRFEDAGELASALADAIAGKLSRPHRRRALELLAALPWAEPDLLPASSH